MSETREIFVENFLNDRKFGWGWSCTPTGEDAYSIRLPSGPDYTGTLNQIQEAKDNDAAFNNLGGAFYSTAYFYDGALITHTWAYTLTKRAKDLPFDPEEDNYRLWREANDRHHWENDEYGYAWVPGFDPHSIYESEFDVKVRVLVQD